MTDESDMSVDIRVFGMEDSDDRSLFRKPQEMRYGRVSVPADTLRKHVTDFLNTMRHVLTEVSATMGEYQLDEVQVSAEVSAKGQISLLGSGGELGGKGGLVFTFKRKPHTAE